MQAVGAARKETGHGARRFSKLSMGGGCALVMALVAQDATPETGPGAALVSISVPAGSGEIAPASPVQGAMASDTRIEVEHDRVAPGVDVETAPGRSHYPHPENHAMTGTATPRALRNAIRASLAAPIDPANLSIAEIAPAPARAIVSNAVTEPEGEPAPGNQPHLATASLTGQPAPMIQPEPIRSDAYMAQISSDRASDPLSFAASSEAMQVSPELALAKMESGRVAMLATAPTRLVLRAGDGAAGEVAIAMVSDDTIAVRLGDLLDIAGSRMDADLLATMRASSAAQSFVTLDQLREAELTITYDPVYDELRLDG